MATSCQKMDALFKNGEPVKAAVGVRPKAAILSMLK
jgi:hypothetical protein